MGERGEGENRREREWGGEVMNMFNAIDWLHVSLYPKQLWSLDFY